MILVDTNVVSEMVRSAPEPKVVQWLDSQAAETLYLSTISVAELLFGIAVLPDGRRKAELSRAVESAMRLFGERLLPFDLAAAKTFTILATRARKTGRPVGVADGQIAAIAATHDLAVATRDTAPFEATGIRFIDPWATPT